MPASSEPPGKFTVDRLPLVTVQVHQLGNKAKSLGMTRQVLDAFEAILARLETRPLEWGDPEYTTKHPGGLVLHGLYFPFIVHYVVYEQERIVCILDISVFPGHPLEGT
jgi:hypothetical protein